LQQELLTICSTQTCTLRMITHAIDEALILADRLVLTTNGSAAGIGDGLSIDEFGRSCNRFAHDADAAA